MFCSGAPHSRPQDGLSNHSFYPIYKILNENAEFSMSRYLLDNIQVTSKLLIIIFIINLHRRYIQLPRKDRPPSSSYNRPSHGTPPEKKIVAVIIVVMESQYSGVISSHDNVISESVNSCN